MQGTVSGETFRECNIEAIGSSAVPNKFDDERLQCTPEELENVSVKARLYWHKLSQEAIIQRRKGILPRHINLDGLLGRVPALPSIPGLTCTYSMNTTKWMSIEASSVWRVEAEDGCGIDGKERTVPAELQVGTLEATKASFSGDCFCAWQQEEGNHNTKNYIGLLVLGWSYILSARLVEMQGQIGSKIIYTDSMAVGYCANNPSDTTLVTLDLGEADEESARWWGAILAPNQGWKAIVFEQEHEAFQAPWSLSIDEMQRIGIRRQRQWSSADASNERHPLSSHEAFSILEDFAYRHDLESQFFAAFATALLLPTHGYFGMAVKLPLPTPDEHQKAILVSGVKSKSAIFGNLPYYMALSSSPSVIMSSLCGMFWDAETTCNHVSSWLHPILNEVPNGKDVTAPGQFYELLVFACAIRCPSLSALWLGAAISGLVPKILKFVESGTPPLDQNGFPWTKCAQSFMDTVAQGMYFSGTSVSRSDVWQIRHLPPVVCDELYYESRPFTPWKPPGRTTKENCELRVQAHESCKRHELLYQYWSWKLHDGSVYHDYGFETINHSINRHSVEPAFPVIPLSLAQTASINASRTVIQWATVNDEGVPCEGIYFDPWVEGILRDDGSESFERSSGEVLYGRSLLQSNECEIQLKNALPNTQVAIYDWLNQD
ncbi:MAG: hypothetical protein MMC23_003314 [Stictis urceolatum]|nr:hypothetical protein [Stictis urceolata]